MFSRQLADKGNLIVWNIIIGVLFIIGGLSGRFALFGTQSSGALTVVGVGLVIWGVIQVIRQRS
jgi:hypothetical protein